MSTTVAASRVYPELAGGRCSAASIYSSKKLLQYLSLRLTIRPASFRALLSYGRAIVQLDFLRARYPSRELA